MRQLTRPGAIGLFGLLVLLASFAAEPAPAGTTLSPVDPWPRSIDLGGAIATVYQPQVEAWDGNRIRFRVVVGLATPGGTEERVGTAWVAAVTRVDRISRLVTLDEVAFTRASFPTLGDGGISYLTALQAAFQRLPQTIALDRLQASLATSGKLKPTGVIVQNIPPRIFVSDGRAALVSIAGAPVLRRIAGTSFERVINTRALILRDAQGSNYYLRLEDGWMTADALDGRWYPVERMPAGLDRYADDPAATTVDVLSGDTARLSRQDGVPTVFVSHTPAALVVFDGDPVLGPIPGTTLLRASNTTTPVIVDIVSGHYFVLLAGRWFRAPGLNGPWAHVSARSLPPHFAAIPADDPASAVLASVAGTPQAKEAVLDSTIPQTATVPRTNGPAFAPQFDGHPQYRPITGTPLSYVANSPTPVIRVDPRRYLALESGIWFEATSVFGPWQVAGAVPDIVYSIPVSSPLHHVTYVRIYSSTREVVELGYTPGYTGTMVTPEGVAVHGTGYAHSPWVGSAYFPSPATYGVGFPSREQGARNVYAHWGSAVYTGWRMHRQLAGRTVPSPTMETFAAANIDNDCYADVDGRVCRRSARGWEKQGARGWEHAALEECAFASGEQAARAAGAERFERHRAAGGERLPEDRFGSGERGPGAGAFRAGGVQVGGLRGRRTEP